MWDCCGLSILKEDGIGKLGGVQRTKRVQLLRKKSKTQKHPKKVHAKSFAQSLLEGTAPKITSARI